MSTCPRGMSTLLTGCPETTSKPSTSAPHFSDISALTLAAVAVELPGCCSCGGGSSTRDPVSAKGEATQWVESQGSRLRGVREQEGHAEAPEGNREGPEVVLLCIEAATGKGGGRGGVEVRAW